jgi:hypothetical protein
LSNASFKHKKKQLADHALLLNSRYFSAEIERWDETAIKARAQALTEVILEIWPSLGEVPTALNVRGEKPKSIIILGDVREAKSWRDVAFQMAETVAGLTNRFDLIAAEMPAFFTTEERQRSRQMSNGWWLYINLSSSTVLNFCDRLASLAGLTSEDWEIVME